MRALNALALLCGVWPWVGVAADPAYAALPGGAFESIIVYDDIAGPSQVAPFALQRHPVSNAAFLSFVKTHPQWRRDQVPLVFAETGYLSHWSAADALGADAVPEQPLTRVSWFAANAYCEAQGARLPTWLEWEYAAAADETRTDARSDPAWRERMLGWYARPSTAPLPLVGQSPADVWGVHDLHGLVWEWVDDYAAMLVTSDNRQQSATDRLKFCGAGALSMRDRENYAVMMRVAMLSALSASATTRNLGFRCAKDLPRSP